MGGKRYFGNVRKLPSGRFQTRYTGPNGKAYAAKKPDGKALTFDTRGDAEAWLSLRQSEILCSAWLPPAEPELTTSPVLVRAYAEAWLADRDLEQTTRDHYAQLLRDHVYPVFGDKAVVDVTPASAWHARLKTTTGPTARAHAYALLR